MRSTLLSLVLILSASALAQEACLPGDLAKDLAHKTVKRIQNAEVDRRVAKLFIDFFSQIPANRMKPMQEYDNALKGEVRFELRKLLLASFEKLVRAQHPGLASAIQCTKEWDPDIENARTSTISSNCTVFNNPKDKMTYSFGINDGFGIFSVCAKDEVIVEVESGDEVGAKVKPSACVIYRYEKFDSLNSGVEVLFPNYKRGLGFPLESGRNMNGYREGTWDLNGSGLLQAIQERAAKPCP